VSDKVGEYFKDVRVHGKIEVSFLGETEPSRLSQCQEAASILELDCHKDGETNWRQGGLNHHGIQRMNPRE